MAYSNNVITVKLLDAVGVPAFTDFATSLGLPLRARHDLTLALGTEEVTLADLVLAYAPLANGGSRPKSRSIIRIYDRRHMSWTNNPPALAPVLSPASAYVTTQMMRDVMVYGTAKSLKKFSMKRPSAGKTGTTDNNIDAWFAGSAPGLTTGVWIGHDRSASLGAGETGGWAAAPVWQQFMQLAVR